MSIKKEKNAEIICRYCGNKYSDILISESEKGIIKEAICKKCKKITLHEEIPNQEYLEQHEIEKYDEGIKCPFCNYETSEVSMRDNGEFTTKIAKCKNCGQITLLEVNPRPKEIVVSCPFCHSNDCKKISSTSKAVSAVAFGVFALGKVTKTWHCNNCGSNFG